MGFVRMSSCFLISVQTLSTLCRNCPDFLNGFSMPVELQRRSFHLTERIVGDLYRHGESFPPVLFDRLSLPLLIFFVLMAVWCIFSTELH